MMTVSAKNEIGGVIFDAVGTLIDPRPSVAEVYSEAARRQGIELDRAEVKARFYRHFGRDEGDASPGALATDEPNERRRWRRIVHRVLPELPDPDGAFDQLWEHFSRPESWHVFADTGAALRALHAGGLPLAIASNFDGRLRAVARGLPEIAPWLDSVVVSSEVGYRKPHPEFYRAACARLGLPASRVLCVGDDPENDLRGPERAGLRALLIDRDRRQSPDLPAVPDLVSLVDRLLGRA